MTPQRALIEAAERACAIMQREIPWNAEKELRAAISSAKAAEEGTTDYFVETLNKKGEWVHAAWIRKGGVICSHLGDYGEAISAFSGIFIDSARLVKRTRTETNSVIEVREK